MYARPTIEDEGEPLSFGVSGKLWRDSLVMYDRNTRSLWSQLLGRAVAGPLTGEELAEIPAETTTWADWRRSHPDTLVLRKPHDEMVLDIRRRGSNYDQYHEDAESIGVVGTENPDRRLGPKTLVFGFEGEDRPTAVPLSLLEQSPVLNARVGDRPVVFFSPPGEAAVMAFERRLDGEEITFERVSGEEEADGDARLVVRDSETGSTWSWRRGECVQGELEGRGLERIPGKVAYWGVWAQFHRNTRVIRSGF